MESCTITYIEKHVLSIHYSIWILEDAMFCNSIMIIQLLYINLLIQSFLFLLRRNDRQLNFQLLFNEKLFICNSLSLDWFLDCSDRDIATFILLCLFFKMRTSMIRAKVEMTTTARYTKKSPERLSMSNVSAELVRPVLRHVSTLDVHHFLCHFSINPASCILIILKNKGKIYVT